jgi:hypothetical protein
MRDRLSSSLGSNGPIWCCLGAVAWVFALAATSCTSVASPGAAPGPAEPGISASLEGDATRAEIATLHRRKCGNCHTRVEPGALPRATIEAAMLRHRRRAKLTEEQWAELVEFLSRTPGEPRHTAALPLNPGEK